MFGPIAKNCFGMCRSVNAAPVCNTFKQLHFSEKNTVASRCYRQVLLSVPTCFEALSGIGIWKVVQSQKEHGEQFHIWPHLYLHVPESVCTHTCIYICMYTYTYIHAHTHTSVHPQCSWLMKINPNKIPSHFWRYLRCSLSFPSHSQFPISGCLMMFFLPKVMLLSLLSIWSMSLKRVKIRRSRMNLRTFWGIPGSCQFLFTEQLSQCRLHTKQGSVGRLLLLGTS